MNNTGKLSSIQADIQDLKSIIINIQHDVSSLKNDVIILKTDVAELKNDVAVLKTDVAELKNDVAIMKNDIQLLNDRMDRSDISNEIRFTRIERSLTTLQGFQRNESDAIEFELQKIVEKYLLKKYAHMTIIPYKMKTPKHPYTNKQLTDFDGAFLLIPYQYKIDYTRLQTAGITYRPMQEKKGNTILVIVEAKHYMNKERIKRKIQQFNILHKIVWLAKKITENPNIVYDESMKENNRKVSAKFIKTVERNEFQYITDFILFFGAAYWEKGILYDFERDVAVYKQLAVDFEANGDQKLLLKAAAIEARWAGEVSSQNNIISALRYVKFIEPSGGRYTISEMDAPSGITTFALNGGMRQKIEKDIAE